MSLVPDLLTGFLNKKKIIYCILFILQFRYIKKIKKNDIIGEAAYVKGVNFFDTDTPL